MKLFLENTIPISNYSTLSSNTVTIVDHGPVPFNQTTTYYLDDNMTEYVVDAHLHYSKNTIYRDHSKGIVIAIVGDSCIFGDDSGVPIPLIKQDKVQIRTV